MSKTPSVEGLAVVVVSFLNESCKYRPANPQTFLNQVEDKLITGGCFKGWRVVVLPLTASDFVSSLEERLDEDELAILRRRDQYQVTFLGLLPIVGGQLIDDEHRQMKVALGTGRLNQFQWFNLKPEDNLSDMIEFKSNHWFNYVRCHLAKDGEEMRKGLSRLTRPSAVNTWHCPRCGNPNGRNNKSCHVCGRQRRTPLTHEV